MDIIVGPSVSNSLLIRFFISAKNFLCLRHFWAGEVSVAYRYGLDNSHCSRRHIVLSNVNSAYLVFCMKLSVFLLNVS